MENHELYHHGIKGMRWGIRRTEAQLSRGRSKKDDMSDDAKEVSGLRNKKPSQMSNAELKKLNERKQLEDNYKRLNPNALQKGWKYVVAAAGVLGTTTALIANSQKLINIGKKVSSSVVADVGKTAVSAIS